MGNKQALGFISIIFFSSWEIKQKLPHSPEKCGVDNKCPPSPFISENLIDNTQSKIQCFFLILEKSPKFMRNKAKNI